MLTSILLLTKNSSTLKLCVTTIRKHTVLPIELIILNGGDPISFPTEIVVDYQNTLTRRIEWGYNYSTGNFVTVFNDDFYPQPWWLENAYHYFFTHFPDGRGMLALNDGRGTCGKKTTVVLASKKFIKHDLKGVFYDVAYDRYRVDRDLALRAEATGRYKYCPESLVFHDHKNASNEMPLYYEHDCKVFVERWGDLRR